MIGIFDSGSGGLSVFRAIYKLLPNQQYIFFSDNANCPYGEKSREFIQERCCKITEFLLNKGANIIVVACNTATGAAINMLREKYKIKFIGMEPAIKPAALYSHTGVIGVLATAGTLSGAKYLNNKEKYATDVKVVESVGSGWVELVENGEIEGNKAEKIVLKSLKPLLEAGADNIVLGCTHYPFLKNIIEKFTGKDINIIDPAPAVASQLIKVMKTEELLNEDNCEQNLRELPDIKLYTSGEPEALDRIFKIIFPKSNLPILIQECR